MTPGNELDQGDLRQKRERPFSHDRRRTGRKAIGQPGALPQKEREFDTKIITLTAVFRVSKNRFLEMMLPKELLEDHERIRQTSWQ